jgi:hypothetical protein
MQGQAHSTAHVSEQDAVWKKKNKEKKEKEKQDAIK